MNIDFDKFNHFCPNKKYDYKVIKDKLTVLKRCKETNKECIQYNCQFDCQIERRNNV